MFETYRNENKISFSWHHNLGNVFEDGGFHSNTSNLVVLVFIVISYPACKILNVMFLGHPVCDTCMRSPRVTACPTCRQKIVGRNVLAEKLAKSMYGNS